MGAGKEVEGGLAALLVLIPGGSTRVLRQGVGALPVQEEEDT